HEHHHHDGECCHHEHEHHHHEYDEHGNCSCGHHHDHHDHHDHHHHHDGECCHHEHEHHHHEYDEHGNCSCGHHHDHHDHHDHHHHHADEVFVSYGAETTKKFNEAELKAALESFTNSDRYGMILRAKGIVAGDDGRWIHFDYIPGEPDVRHGGAGVIGRLCVIGSKLDKTAISEVLGVELK
ncbi:MAG: cobalamin biosynthesis protein CobW, partial [Ruminococcaceae bacterium]|nr:cobalamin biosynthesis protein CobW [Oscillospiraceae bacterium]